MSDQPTALRLADTCEGLSQIADAYSEEAYRDAAAELRRLHEEVEALRLAIYALRADTKALRADAERDTTLLRQALEALENSSPLGFSMETDKRFYATITALRQRLGDKP